MIDERSQGDVQVVRVRAYSVPPPNAGQPDVRPQDAPIWLDRYGGDWPDPAIVCPGPCDGLGRYPVPDASAADGWRFVVCLDCGGTGKALDADQAWQDAQRDSPA